LECDPSQKGGCFVNLHPQKYISLLSIAKYFSDLNFPSFLCAPLQKGCLSDKPETYIYYTDEYCGKSSIEYEVIKSFD